MARRPVDSEARKDPTAIHAAAVTQLARRDYASGELRQKLIGRGFDADLVAQAIAQLTESGALDDARFAENHVTFHAQRGQGPVRIAAELRTLGVSAELIERALQAGPDWRQLAHRARVRKFGREVPTAWAEKSRQARFLQYRGFSSDHIRSALGPELDPDE